MTAKGASDHRAGKDGWGAGRHVRRATVCAVVAVLVTAVGCRVFQYNIGNGAGRHGENDVIARVRAMQSYERPILITLNEVCGQRFYDIHNAIGSLGYTGLFHATNPSGCGGSGAGLGYGNAMFWLGTRIGEVAWHFYTVQRPSSNELRNIDCVRFAVGQQEYMGCVTHLDNERYYAEQQAEEALAFVNFLRAFGGNIPTLVGGDFNLEPHQSPMGSWYAAFDEVDGPGRQDTYEDRKIDYVFLSPELRRLQDAQVWSGLSDHRMLIGDVAVR